MAALIGISSWRGTLPGNNGQEVAHLFAQPTYVRAVEKAGGVPVLVPELGPEAVDGLLDRLDGIVLVGGPDVDPANYGATALETTVPALPGRDAFDLELARRCVARDHPLLAVCRGVQVLNVALGGSLHQHLPHHMVGDKWNDDVHEVIVEPGSRCAEILGTTRLMTNSLHHQAIDRPGEGVRVVARADDGTVEAIEVDDAPAVMGVQWHPELLRHRAEHLALFGDLVRRAGVPSAR
jgi:gamma-glutamyl-gamma-aminobutyrate hydrolase PuuD